MPKNSNIAVYTGPNRMINKKYLQNGSKNEIVHFDKKNKIVFVKDFGWLSESDFNLPLWMI